MSRCGSISSMGAKGHDVAAAVPLLVPALVLAALMAAACQGMDRVERPPEVVTSGDPDSTTGRATRLRAEGDVSTLPEAASGRLTAAVATRRLAEIESTRGQERLDRIRQFVDEYPRALGLSRLHLLAGEAHQDLEQHGRAADAFERAVVLSGTDLTGLPFEPDLAYRVGWARYQAGDHELGLDWLVRTTFISSSPRVEQALRYFRGELGRQGDFDAWLRERRTALAVRAPDFELPGYRRESVRLSELPGRVKVVNFWTPT